MCVNALALSHSYDVIIADGEDSIISKFRDFNAQIVFSAEGFCWPDRSLAVSECVPMVTEWMSCLDLLLICSQSIRKLLLESDSFVLEVRCSPQSFPVPHYPHLSPSHYLHLSLCHTTPTSPCTTLPPLLPHHTTPTAGMLWQNLAITRALCGFHGMNFIYSELRGLVMCQQRESA